MTDERITSLTETPDWRYLLKEFYEFYRRMSSGGSDKIRAHQRAVREAISKTLADRPAVRLGPPVRRPVTVHLRRALDLGRRYQMDGVIRAIDAVADDLSWQFGYDKVPKGLENRYAYAEIAGPNGPVATERVILGLVLFAPGCVYPAHAHDDITESYICLSGAVSENHQGVYEPGSLIFNPPGHMHRITVSDREPSLLGYAWVGPAEQLRGQKMVFSRPRPGR
ncbi:dimethlysulfonioproprionate lyase DddL [Rhodobacteraceae bacterium 2CG4]|uniref:Dimethlysulfonioproprionate lyase DddL n=1 Tax=Halovulum marinum TaxID=2662447 RepID=A0A6L5Z041_9RHOB|nr:dimethylsulfonioproprionate lyase family protein [Halovulum marinum]MSU89901.1 dimethlysulfonioproprionate lyase DddL [Halovulum marinum]